MLDIPCEQPLDTQKALSVLECLVKHILWMRKQIPLPLDSLRRSVHEEIMALPTKMQSRVCLRAKFAQKFLKGFEEFFQQLGRVMESSYVEKVSVLLGSSAARPQEVYDIHMNYIPSKVFLAQNAPLLIYNQQQRTQLERKTGLVVVPFLCEIREKCPLAAKIFFLVTISPHGTRLIHELTTKSNYAASEVSDESVFLDSPSEKLQEEEFNFFDKIHKIMEPKYKLNFQYKCPWMLKQVSLRKREKVLKVPYEITISQSDYGISGMYDFEESVSEKVPVLLSSCKYFKAFAGKINFKKLSQLKLKAATPPSVNEKAYSGGLNDF